MRKSAIFVFGIVLLTSCASGMSNVQPGWTIDDKTGAGNVQLDEGSIKPEYDSYAPESQSAPAEYGPFFTPAGSDLQSVTLNYFTAKPQKTIVYFSMVGDIDWVRRDNNLTLFHQMTFPHLEENAVYRFELETDSPLIQKVSSIKTIPYGSSYQFTFGVAEASGNKIDAKNPPNFLILLSQKEMLSHNEFGKVYANNSALLSSTIIIPAFTLDYLGKPISMMNDGIFFFRYVNSRFVIINKELANPMVLSKWFTEEKNQKNFIIFGAVSKETVMKTTQMYFSKVSGIFTLNQTGVPGTEAVNGYKSQVVDSAMSALPGGGKLGMKDGW
ncbi:MAG: hypothetical protein A2Y33_00505 [Spirochaetes bacterium GWF1_51_8]|nr:MAG: hypothetical protein A2Y33_00505 [Spirochaetes bacterium GWF1_51_8]